MARLPAESMPASATLRSYPGRAVLPPALLEQIMIPPTRAANAYRQRFGRSISMDRIEVALNAAYLGQMRDLTDISRETIDADPHLASVLNKRFGAVSSLPWEVIPASGIGVDVERAQFYADVVREQIKSLKTFRQNLLQLAWSLYDGRAALENHWSQVVGGGVSHPTFGSVGYVITALSWIHPRRLSFGPYREVRIVDESYGFVGGNFSAIGFPIDSAPGKFIYWLPQLFAEYPEREGLAPRCLYWSFFKRFGARERMILVELFGKPWRIVEVDEESTASTEELADADNIADALGSSYTARLPRGTKLNVVSPPRSAGDVHQEVITESDRQISKLVLGQTGTTDGVPSGLNNNQANVMQDEQLMILTRDAAGLSEIIETQLCDLIIAVNFGDAAVTHAPHFKLRSDLPADRNQELLRLQAALNAGMEIALTEAYEVSGFRKPGRDEPLLKIDQPPTPALAPVPPAARAVIVWPEGGSPAAGEQQPPPATAAVGPGAAAAPAAPVGAPDVPAMTTVNEARDAAGLGPLLLPSGSEDPRGAMTIEEFKSQVGDVSQAGLAATSTTVQTLIFDKDKFDKSEATAWAREHDYHVTKGVDETDSSYRIRQRDPGDFQDGSFRTIELKPGVKAVIGKLKTTSAGLSIQSLIFDKAEFGEGDVSPWAREHGYRT